MNYYCWASCLEKNSGEGKLSLLFLSHINKYTNSKIICFSNFDKGIFTNGKYIINKKNKKKVNKKNNFYNNYIKIFYGIFLLWYYYLNKKKTIFIGYLPVWNFIIFLLLPPKTILGPITGNIINPKKIYGIFSAKVIIIFFSYITIALLKYRYKFFIFAHEELYFRFKKYLSKEILYNFQLLYFSKSKKNLSRSNNLIVYNRCHKSKNTVHLLKLIIKKIKFNKIVIVGRKLKPSSICDKKIFFNIGNIKHEKLIKLIGNFRYSIVSDENFFSFFTLDAISNNLVLFYNTNRYKTDPNKYFVGGKFININKIQKNYKTLVSRRKVFIKNEIKKKIALKLKNYFKFVLDKNDT